MSFSYHFIFYILAKSKTTRKRHSIDNQYDSELLIKIYFSVIFLLAIKLNSIYNLHERLFQFSSKSIVMQSYALLDP